MSNPTCISAPMNFTNHPEWSFPPMTELERKILIEFGKDEHLTLVSLINILSSHLNTIPNELSFIDKIKKLDFTMPHNNNIFVKLLLHHCLLGLIDKDEKITCPNKRKELKKPVLDKLKDYWNEFVEKYTPGE
jgi:hypothetical protein